MDRSDLRFQIAHCLQAAHLAIKLPGRKPQVFIAQKENGLSNNWESPALLLLNPRR